MALYRVLVVDDSPFMRKIISDMISVDKQFEIVATASNGQEAFDATALFKPDVITMDLEMPQMNGLEALVHIMKRYPTPTIMMSSTSDDGTRMTIKALQFGAIDFIRKPAGPTSPDIQTVGEQLLEKMHIAVLSRKQQAAQSETVDEAGTVEPDAETTEELKETKRKPVEKIEFIDVPIEPPVVRQAAPELEREEIKPEAQPVKETVEPSLIQEKAEELPSMRAIAPSIHEKPSKLEAKTPELPKRPDMQNKPFAVPKLADSKLAAKPKLTTPAPEVKPRVEAKVEPKTEVPKPKLEPKAKLETKPDLQPKLDTKPKLEPKPRADIKPEVKQPTSVPARPAPMPADLFDEPVAPRLKKSAKSSSFRHLVAIGTSTGGPRALHEVITALPENLPAPVLVVQHMPPKFTHSLAQRLDSFSGLQVTEATQGERVYAGVVYIAPGGSHMELAKDSQGYYIRLNEQPPRGGHRPSVDVMFESCMPFTELTRHSVIMTGMGSDGAKGMKALMESGGKTAIAEAEETCVVYGMPRSAVELGAAKTVVPLGRIASAIVEAVMK
ncbi:two-component system chemotaxis response regulator CheB [Paenibacillus phyllosphaerae]|uniref:Protein-glutamate methylesterase/protein-glutamine glutaminase n=1 Tax=Paenibacillus phyllosphaerae TaxID=274593 RepID=A0A7W5AW91_9BACL|nr:chemotaxis protein CheB [Paenibacillus phyllosphaerae]MBB3109411.1 two-component system chemotaxis response regulator CheB [Paenibacillus phyllosphaerae]